MINWLIVSFAVAVGLFAAWYIFCAREIHNVTKEIKRALEGLTADNAETAFAKSELLLPAWKDFDASLTSDKKISTASAAKKQLGIRNA